MHRSWPGGAVAKGGNARAERLGGAVCCACRAWQEARLGLGLRLLGWMPPARARARALLVAATAAVLIRPLLSAVNLPCALSCMPFSAPVHNVRTLQYLLTGRLTLLDLVR